MEAGYNADPALKKSLQLPMPKDITCAPRKNYVIDQKPALKNASPPEETFDERKRKAIAIYPWFTSFEDKIKNGTPIASCSVLLKLFKDLSVNIKGALQLCYSKKSRCPRLLLLIEEALPVIHYTYEWMLDPPPNAVQRRVYLFLMSEVVSAYIDLHIRHSGSSHSSIGQTSRELATALALYLNGSEEHMCEVLLKCRCIVTKYKDVCKPVLQNFLRNASCLVIDEVAYMRFCLVYRLLRKLIDGEEARLEVGREACRKLKPTEHIIAGVREMRSTVPSLPPMPLIEKNMTTFLVTTSLDANKLKEDFIKQYPVGYSSEEEEAVRSKSRALPVVPVSNTAREQWGMLAVTSSLKDMVVTKDEVEVLPLVKTPPEVITLVDDEPEHPKQPSAYVTIKKEVNCGASTSKITNSSSPPNPPAQNSPPSPLFTTSAATEEAPQQLALPPTSRSEGEANLPRAVVLPSVPGCPALTSFCASCGCYHYIRVTPTPPCHASLLQLSHLTPTPSGQPPMIQSNRLSPVATTSCQPPLLQPNHPTPASTPVCQPTSLQMNHFPANLAAPSSPPAPSCPAPGVIPNLFTPTSPPTPAQPNNLTPAPIPTPSCHPSSLLQSHPPLAPTPTSSCQPSCLQQSHPPPAPTPTSSCPSSCSQSHLIPAPAPSFQSPVLHPSHYPVAHTPTYLTPQMQPPQNSPAVRVPIPAQSVIGSTNQAPNHSSEVSVAQSHLHVPIPQLHPVETFSSHVSISSAQVSLNPTSQIQGASSVPSVSNSHSVHVQVNRPIHVPQTISPMHVSQTISHPSATPTLTIASVSTATHVRDPNSDATPVRYSPITSIYPTPPHTSFQSSIMAKGTISPTVRTENIRPPSQVFEVHSNTVGYDPILSSSSPESVLGPDESVNFVRRHHEANLKTLKKPGSNEFRIQEDSRTGPSQIQNHQFSPNPENQLIYFQPGNPGPQQIVNPVMLTEELYGYQNRGFYVSGPEPSVSFEEGNTSAFMSALQNQRHLIGKRKAMEPEDRSDNSKRTCRDDHEGCESPHLQVHSRPVGRDFFPQNEVNSPSLAWTEDETVQQENIGDVDDWMNEFDCGYADELGIGIVNHPFRTDVSSTTQPDLALHMPESPERSKQTPVPTNANSPSKDGDPDKRQSRNNSLEGLSSAPFVRDSVGGRSSNNSTLRDQENSVLGTNTSNVGSLNLMDIGLNDDTEFGSRNNSSRRSLRPKPVASVRAVRRQGSTTPETFNDDILVKKASVMLSRCAESPPPAIPRAGGLKKTGRGRGRPAAAAAAIEYAKRRDSRVSSDDMPLNSISYANESPPRSPVDSSDDEALSQRVARHLSSKESQPSPSTSKNSKNATSSKTSLKEQILRRAQGPYITRTLCESLTQHTISRCNLFATINETVEALSRSSRYAGAGTFGSSSESL